MSSTKTPDPEPTAVPRKYRKSRLASVAYRAGFTDGLDRGYADCMDEMQKLRAKKATRKKKKKK